MRFGLPVDYALDDAECNISYRPFANKLNELENNKNTSDEFVDVISKRVDLVQRTITNAIKNKENHIRENYNSLQTSTSRVQGDRFSDSKASSDAMMESLVIGLNDLLKLQNTSVEQIITAEKERQRQIELKNKALELEQKKREQEEKEKREQEKRRLEKLEQEKIEEEKRKSEEKLLKEREEAEKLRIESKERERQSKGLTSNIQIEEEYFKYMRQISDIKKDVVEAVEKDKDLKKSLGVLKRKINPKFGQLSSSFEQLNHIEKEVIELINLAKNNSELSYKWILNFVAKAVVSQAETEVTVKPTAALPLSRLSYTLLESFPEFQYFLSSRFTKKCPVIIGYTCSIDSEEGRKRMGWKRQDLKWENEAKYDERLSGICTVWSVMCRLENQSVEYFSQGSSWKFLARIMNMNLELLTNVHFACLSNWWDAAAKEFGQLYGKQALKLLRLMSVDLTNKVSNKKFPSAARLLILGDDLFKNNKIESLKEMER